MSISSSLRSIAYERADLCRTVEYMKNIINDSPIHDRALDVEPAGVVTEGADDYITEACNNLTDESINAERDEEISRILNSKNTKISFDEMIGITNE